MKTKLFYLLLMVLLIPACSADISTDKEQTVTFLTTITCDHCKDVMFENIPHEEGVSDLKVQVPEKLVTITFNKEKNSVENFIRLFQKLGYEAEIKK